MAAVSPEIAYKRDWMLANPWVWLCLGLAFSAWSCLLTRIYLDRASDTRIILLALGVLATGAGVYLRWRDKDTPYLTVRFSDWIAQYARLAMGCIYAAAGLGVTGVLLVATVDGSCLGFYPGATFLVWLTAAPLSFGAASRCLRIQHQQDSVDVEEETGLAFVVAAGVCVLGCFTLYLGKEMQDEWDTMRLFFRACAAVSLYGGALALVSKGMLRAAVSIAFVLHFTAISNACLAAPPAPWVLTQSWMRLFRPYLEFMYLNNAYHFYAPEPGPASYLWFRVIFSTPEGKDQGLWYKVPDLDEDGRSKHPVALEYQRYLAMTESVAPNAAMPAEIIFDNNKGRWMHNPFYANRLALDPEETQVVGMPDLKQQLRIPFNKHIPRPQQVAIPTQIARQLLSSYARYVARKYATHPEEPGWKCKSVKIYRVIHWIPPVQWHLDGIPPTDPELYRPFYSGNYRPSGEQIDDQDPYLYWLLPSIRRDPNDPVSAIKDYCRLHAGDPLWYRAREEQEWSAKIGPGW